MKLTIRVKLFASFSIVLALLLAITVVSIMKMSDMGAKTNEINDKWMPSVTVLGEINAGVSDIERLILKYIVETDGQVTNQLMGEISSTLLNIQNDRKKYEKLISSASEQKMYEVFSTNYQAYVDKLPNILSEGSANNFAKATELQTAAHPLWQKSKDYITKLIDVNTKGAGVATDDSVSLFNSGRSLVLIFSIAAVILAIATALVISMMISSPVRQMSKLAEQVASGDLTGEEIKVKSRDELGVLAGAFNAMVHNLRQLIHSVSMTSDQVAASSEELTASAEQNSKASEQIAATIGQVAAGTSQQVDSVRQSSQSVSEMSAGAQQIASSAQSVSGSAVDAAAKSSEGNTVIRHAVTQMDAIHQSITSSADLVAALGERSDEISSISGVITEIARQTNLLALNAAIEAARAGEHGRGFAVVANEVRKLAEQSSQSAQQISDLVSGIQLDTNSAVQSMVVSTNEVTAGIEAVTSAGQSFEQILQAVNKVAREIEDVSAASEQMSATTDDLVHSMSRISNIAEEAASGAHNVSAATQQQLASMEEITASAASLSGLAEELQVLINKFKV